MKKILAFSGSSSDQSINQLLVKLAASKVEGETVQVIDIRDYPMPLYNPDLEQSKGFPESALKLKQILAEHDALMIASPEHNGSMPAVFKNTIDWLSRMVEPMQPFFGDSKKPVLLLSTSPGPNGGATNLATLANLMPWWGGDVIATYSLGSFFDHFSEGTLSEQTDAEIKEVVERFVAAI